MGGIFKQRDAAVLEPGKGAALMLSAHRASVQSARTVRATVDPMIPWYQHQSSVYPFPNPDEALETYRATETRKVACM